MNDFQVFKPVKAQTFFNSGIFKNHRFNLRPLDFAWDWQHKVSLTGIVIHVPVWHFSVTQSPLLSQKL